MDIQKYIASGILEQYALGNTSEEESREVEQYVSAYPEIAAELDTIQDSLEQLAMADARTPRPEIEEALMRKLENGDLTTSEEQAPPPPRSGPSFTAMLLAGLLMCLGLLAYQMFRYQSIQKNLQRELEESQEELEELKIACDVLKNTTTTLSQYASIVSDPNNQAVSMNGQEIAPTSLASVYWNPQVKKSYLEIKNLPVPPSGKQYQLWAIVDGAPVDMGVFNLTDGLGELQEVPFIENPQAFAVTLEEAGGSPTPTLDQMYVLGNRS